MKTILDEHIIAVKRPNVELGAKARIGTDDTKCIKCKMQAKTKAVLCEPGNHWVHYNCDQLIRLRLTIYLVVHTSVKLVHLALVNGFMAPR